MEYPARPLCHDNNFTVAERARLETVFRWLKAEDGNPFAGFLKALAATGCTIGRKDPENNFFSDYAGYSRTSGEFTNGIRLNSEALADEYRLLSAIVHEGLHALQHACAAALHASPYNQAALIFLCPRDYIYARELCERDAHAKQAVADVMLKPWRRWAAEHQVRPAFLNICGFRLADVMLDSRLPDWLFREGLAAMEDFPASRDHNEDCLRDIYSTQHLVNYWTGMKQARNGASGGRPVFARLEAEDILAIGAYGANPFEDRAGNARPALLRPPALAPGIEASLQRLNAQLGITDESTLPTLGAALRVQETDRETFLRNSIKPRFSAKILAKGPAPA